MGKVIQVKMAKPTVDNWNAAVDFVSGLEAFIENDLHPVTDFPCSDDEFMEWIRNEWRNHDLRLDHCLWAGKTAIDNACDPDAEVLEFNSTIQNALDENDKLRTALKDAIRRPLGVVPDSAAGLIGED